MKEFTTGLTLLLFLAGAGCLDGHTRPAALPLEQVRLIDLTHAFDIDTIVWPIPS